MPQDFRLSKNLTGRGYAFSLLGVVAMHRGFRAKLLDEAKRYHNIPRLAREAMSEADRHARDARSWLAGVRSRGMGLLP